MKLRFALLTILGCASASMLAQTTLTDSDLKGAYTLKSIVRQVNLCHDPSIFVDNITNPSSPVYYGAV